MRFLGLLCLALPLCAATPSASNLLQKAPLRFEEATGADRFIARGLSYGIQFRDRQTLLNLRTESGDTRQIRMTLAGSKQSRPAGVQPLALHTAIYRGAQSEWRTAVPTFAKLQRSGIYPGIDLVYYGAGKQLEYDFIVAPNADASRIAMRFNGSGVKATLDREGQLVLRAGGAALVQHAPAIYQMDESGNPVNIEGGYRIARDGSVGFRLAAYDHSRPLIIDPVLSYSAYIGSSASDGVIGVGTDSTGALYVTGFTSSTDLPVPEDAQQSKNAGSQDVFVGRIVNGQFTYLTYIGGTNFDDPKAMAVGSTGNVYVTGSTSSADFPMVNAAQTAIKGTSDAFLFRVEPVGFLAYSSYLGGSGDETGLGVATSPGGIAYVTGVTTSNDYPINSSTAFQGGSGGGYDMFVAKFATFNSGADSLPGSSYLGGDSEDTGMAIAVDPTGGVWVGGITFSGNFPQAGSPYRSGYSGGGDVVLTKLNADLTSISYTTYFGGGDIDEPHKIVVDNAGRVYVSGVTLSTDLPVTGNAFQAQPNGNGDLFIAIFDPSLAGPQQLTYSSYFGGSRGEVPYDMVRDPATGTLTLTGYTLSTNFPTTADAFQSASRKTGVDGFIITVNPAKSGIDGLVFASYVTSAGSQVSTSLAVGPDGTLYIGGATSGSIFPDGAAQRSTPRGSVDGFLMGLKP